MIVSYKWLQIYFDKQLPSPEKLAEILTFHSFEVEEVNNVGDDWVFDIDVLPNRAHDCLSHRGIAKELSVLLNIPLKNDPLLNRIPKWIESNILEVFVDNHKLCRRYSAAVVQGVNVGPSPNWLKESLEAIGQKSINNIVDATNYVMFSIGQPLHAFDMDLLTEKNGTYNITVRDGKENEKIVALDDEEYIVGPKNLLITDGNNSTPIGIAGVKGGKSALINEKTKNIIIESANFNPASIRKTSQTLKLHTDASVRFQNELSQELTFYGIEEVVKIIQKIAGGEVEGYVDVYPRKKKLYKVGISTMEINKLLGLNIEDKDVTDIFDRFGFKYEIVNPIDKALQEAQELIGVSYTYGASVSYDAPNTFDCSSFIAYVFKEAGVWLPRMSIDQYVYGKEINEVDIQSGDIVFSIGSDKEKNHYKSVEFMAGKIVEKGVSHCGIYLGDGKIIHASGKENKGEVVTEELIESNDFKSIVGVRRVADNVQRFVVTVPFERLDLLIPTDMIEEVGRVYGYKNIEPKMLAQSDKKLTTNKHFYYTEKIKQFFIGQGFSEVYTYSLRSDGEVELANAFASDKAFLRNQLKDGLTQILELNEKNADLLGLAQIKIFEIGTVFTKNGEYTALGVGIRNIKKGIKLASAEATASREDEELKEVIELLGANLQLGHPVSKNAWTPDVQVGSKDGIFEINFDELLEKLPAPPDTYDVFEKIKPITYKPFSLYPPVLRDIAVWVPDDKKEIDVLALIKKEAGEILVSSQLFDEYAKDNKISYAFKLVFQSYEKTLTDEEVNESMEKVTKVLNSRDDWEVR